MARGIGRNNGRWIAFTRQPGGRGNIVVDVVAPDGTGQRTVAIGESPSWSPDDTMLAFHTCRNNTCGIYKGSINGGDAIPIVGDDGGLPDWSPDGKRIVYQKEVDGQKQLFLINPDGSGKKQLTSGAAMHVDAAWSPDGAYIYYRATEGGSWGIYRNECRRHQPDQAARQCAAGELALRASVGVAVAVT